MSKIAARAAEVTRAAGTEAPARETSRARRCDTGPRSSGRPRRPPPSVPAPAGRRACARCSSASPARSSGRRSASGAAGSSSCSFRNQASPRHAAQHRAQPERALLPGAGPALLVGVLGPDLEEESHAVPRHRHLEVAGLLVAAGLGPERHPGVVGRIDGPPQVTGHVGVRLRAGGPAHARDEAVADGLELGTDATADHGHARLEALRVEGLEVRGVECGCCHRCSPAPDLGVAYRSSSGKMGRRTRVNEKRARFDDDRPGASTSRMARASGSKAAR